MNYCDLILFLQVTALCLLQGSTYSTEYNIGPSMTNITIEYISNSCRSATYLLYTYALQLYYMSLSLPVDQEAHMGKQMEDSGTYQQFYQCATDAYSSVSLQDCSQGLVK